MPHLWQVVGGADRGGILVRQGRDISSEKLPERLSTGAIVAEVELVGELVLEQRLHYRRVTGTGPEEGWIGVALEHKELAQRLPPIQTEVIPKSLLKDLKWLLWNQMFHAANTEFAEHSTGDACTDAREDAADDAQRMEKYLTAVEAAEYFLAEELQHLRDQASTLGWEAGNAAAKDRPFSDGVTQQLVPFAGFVPELWNRMLKALLLAAEFMCTTLRKDKAEARRLQSEFEPLWDALGWPVNWYEAKVDAQEQQPTVDGITFRVVTPQMIVKSADGRKLGVLNRGTLCRGEVRTQKDTREWFRMPQELNRDLHEAVKWKDGEAWVNLSEGRPLASLGSLRDKGLVVMGCTQLYSHVKYFARLGEWLRQRGHDVLLWTIETEKTRQAASAHLPDKCLRFLGERPEDKRYWGIWEQVSRDGAPTQDSFDAFHKSQGYILYYITESIRQTCPNLVVTDGFSESGFNHTCDRHAGAVAVVTCPGRKDGFNDNKGAEWVPTLYPTAPSLFDGEIHPTTIVCGPFLPPAEKLERTRHLQEGSTALQQWCSSDSRPIVYISFGTVAVMQEEFLRRFSRALLMMCGVAVPQEAPEADTADDGAAQEDAEAGGREGEGEWLVLHETTCSDLVELVCTVKCGSTPKEIRECRQLCQVEGYGGFCLFQGEAQFWRLPPSEVVANAEAKEHASLHFPAEATLGKATKSPARKAGDGSKPKYRFLWALNADQQKLLPKEALRPSQDLRVEGFVPQQAVLRLHQVAAVISHCGANSSHEALACGIPMVCVPFFMDQYDWCRAVVRRGVGVPVDRRVATPQDICEAVEQVVSRCSEGAQKLGVEMRQFLREGSGLERAGQLCLRAMRYPE